MHNTSTPHLSLMTKARRAGEVFAVLRSGIYLFRLHLLWSCVAVAVGSANAQVVPPSFAPSQILDSLTDRGSRLGVQTTAATMGAGADGREPAAIRVDSIPEDSPLRQINIEEGDVIFSIDWYYFASTDDMRRYVRSIEAGQVLDVMFWKAKDGKTYKARFPMPGPISSESPCPISQAVRQVIPKNMQDVLKKAESGSAIAQRLMGQYAYDSKEVRNTTFKLGGPSHLEWSTCWHKQAARNGDQLSQYEVGYMFDYESSQIGGKNYKNTYLATFWFTKAANQGHLRSLYKLGDKYIKGNGAPMSPEKGKSFVLKAAEGGDLHAMHYDFCYINIDWKYKSKVGC